MSSEQEVKKPDNEQLTIRVRDQVCTS